MEDREDPTATACSSSPMEYSSITATPSKKPSPSSMPSTMAPIEATVMRKFSSNMFPWEMFFPVFMSTFHAAARYATAYRQYMVVFNARDRSSSPTRSITRGGMKNTTDTMIHMMSHLCSFARLTFCRPPDTIFTSSKCVMVYIAWARALSSAVLSMICSFTKSTEASTPSILLRSPSSILQQLAQQRSLTLSFSTLGPVGTAALSPTTCTSSKWLQQSLASFKASSLHTSLAFCPMKSTAALSTPGILSSSSSSSLAQLAQSRPLSCNV